MQRAKTRSANIVGIITKKPVELPTSTTIVANGGSGTVLRYETTAGPIAVKIARDVADTGVSPSLLHEAAAISALGPHPNVVKLLDAYVTAEQMAIVMPLADMALDEYIEQHKNGNEILNKLIILQLLRAVAYIHSRDIIHTDIKTPNILVIEQKDHACPIRVVLTDFGTAHTSRCFELEQLRNGGTLFEIPPEYALGGPYTTQGDVWALGCAIAELLSGIPPFKIDEKNADLLKVLAKQFYLLGTPTEESWPGITSLPKWNPEYGHEKAQQDGILADERFGNISKEATRFVGRMLVINPRQRASLVDLLADPWLDEARALADQPCLAVPPLTSLDCSVALLNRQAPGPTLFAHDNNTRFALYSCLEDIVRKFESTDRVLALSIYLYERSETLMRTAQSDARDRCLAALLVTSSLLDPQPIEIREIPGALTKQAIRKQVRLLLNKVGLDLYVATSYDVLLVLVAHYTDTTKGVARTLLDLSYYTRANICPPEVVALVCIQLACVYSKQTFLHYSRLANMGGLAADVEQALGPELSRALQAYSEPVEILSRAKRGAQSTAEILLGIPLLAEHYTWLVSL